MERLARTFRFTFAFHAREVRFECDYGVGFERIFPETFSFHSDRHDPAELLFQLEDLINRPELLGPRANRRDANELVSRLLAEVPRYLEGLGHSLEGRLPEAGWLHLNQDLALFCQISTRFLEAREMATGRRARIAVYLMRKLMFRSLSELVRGRVRDEYLSRYCVGEVDPMDPADDSSESGFFHTLETGEADAVDRMVMRMAERAFYLWIEGVCLDEANQAFEKEDSPFASREEEVLQAIGAARGQAIERGGDLIPFLRRPSRDCRRILKKLEIYFLRRYDIIHSSVLIHHEGNLMRGDDDRDHTLSWHTPRNHALCLLALVAPFAGAVFFYERAPFLFDLLCSLEVMLVNAASIWFLVYRFCWRRDLSFFHAAVPRIGAGIIVGYLPVFLIDEVWDLASQPFVVLGAVSLFLGLVTLLYIYVEVQRRLLDTALAFARARAIFVLGCLQAFGIGVVMTNLVGSFMVERNWTNVGPVLPIPAIGTVEPLLGQLPRVLGIEPFHAFPSAVLVMTFLSFFIGIFLQLMWEDLPITEPL
jgi:hypothetical protein